MQLAEIQVLSDNDSSALARYFIRSQAKQAYQQKFGSRRSQMRQAFTFNVPRYFNIQLRAREFARKSNSQLLWCHAVDIPMHPGDRDLPEAALRSKLAAWLSRHDQETSHLTSIFPLVKDLPVRITDSIDRDLQLYKGRRGKIYGWTLHPERLFTDFENCESLLDRLPLVIYIHFPEATWTIGKLPRGVYPLKQITKVFGE